LYSSFNTSPKPSRLPSSIQIQPSDRASPGGSISLSFQTMRRSSDALLMPPFSTPLATGST
jgi:hypothetical protein